MRALAANPGEDLAGLLAELHADGRAGARAIAQRLERLMEARAREESRLEAMFVHERSAQAQGRQRIAGVDEAGRGPLAGPIVAAAVVLAFPVPGLDDSKRLSAARRADLYAQLRSGPHAIGVACVSPAEIDAEGIQRANLRAMRDAVMALDPAPDHVLADGFMAPGLTCTQERLVKGDRRSLSIAAASIIAKETRDRLMAEHDAAYPGYGFAEHKGYGTAAHLAALAALGPCPIHRRSFAGVLPPAGGLFEA